MPLTRLEHYLVLSDDIQKTRDFYCNVLGLTEGFRPELDFPGYWLYVGDTPCIHIGDWAAYAVWTKKVGIPISSRAPATGPVDHIAFNATGFDAATRYDYDTAVEVAHHVARLRPRSSVSRRTRRARRRPAGHSTKMRS